jgi:hypothetical protein
VPISWKIALASFRWDDAVRESTEDSAALSVTSAFARPHYVTSFCSEGHFTTGEGGAAEPDFAAADVHSVE